MSRKYTLTEKRETVLRAAGKISTEGMTTFTSYDIAEVTDLQAKSIGLILSKGLEPYGYIKRIGKRHDKTRVYTITPKGLKFAGYDRTPERGTDMVGDIVMTAQEILQRNADNNIPEADPITSGSVRALLSNIVVHMHEMHTNIQKLRAILEG